MKRGIVSLALTLLIAAASGCASVSNRADSIDTSSKTVAFGLKPWDAVVGPMDPMVPDDEPSGGRFF